MMKFLGWLALCAAITHFSAARAGEHEGIEPWQDANRAMRTVPAPLAYTECADVMTPFSDLPVHHCQLLSKYVWVPDLSGIEADTTVTVMFCLKPSTERLIQCFYRTTAGVTMVVPILYRGETL